MSKLSVLNVEAQEADRKRFTILHEVTAEAVTPIFLGRIKEFSSQELAQNFTQEAELLLKFLLSEDEGSRSVWEECDRMVFQDQVACFLRASLSEPEATAADERLVQQFSSEFAGAAWATMISSLCDTAAVDGSIKPEELLPQDLLRGETLLLNQVLADAVHFELTSAQLNQVMVSTWRKLLNSKLAVEGTLYLPEQLHVDCMSMELYLDNISRSQSVAQARIEAYAVRLDTAWHARRARVSAHEN